MAFFALHVNLSTILLLLQKRIVVINEAFKNERALHQTIVFMLPQFFFDSIRSSIHFSFRFIALAVSVYPLTTFYQGDFLILVRRMLKCLNIILLTDLISL